jgi:aminopeptidase-like protein
MKDAATHPEHATFTGDDIYALAEKLFPLHRSITGNGVRKTHDVLRSIIPELTSIEVSSGTKCFDWIIPNEWNLNDAYIADLHGRRIIDIKNSNLHVMSYSWPVDRVMSWEELDRHLISLPDMPDAIPFCTSYFDDRWAFCVTQRQRDAMTDSEYRVVIDSTVEPGALTYGEILVPGERPEEILVHTYTCHPSMGNNETSGMAVTAFLARAILDMPYRKYSYRIVFAPETIGAVTYISRNLDALRSRVIAGFVMTCVGDDRSWSLLPARAANTLPERAGRHVLSKVLGVPYCSYSYVDRGSDERQYCAPGVDLPVVSIMRTKHGLYPEYHTSLDDLTVICPDGLWGGYLATRKAIEIIEKNETLVTTVLCEPWLSPRGLRAPLKDGKFLDGFSRQVSHLMAFCDGNADLLEIAELIDASVFDLFAVAAVLKEQGLLKPKGETPPPEELGVDTQTGVQPPSS